jgi:hypothetical protein
MKIHTRKYRTLLALAAAALTAPAWAMSLAAPSPAQSLPQDRATAAAPLAIESWSAGSATLVPLMAADMPAHHASTIDGPADNTGGTVGKPLDDISFVRQAT